MKKGKKKWLKAAMKLALVAAVFIILLKCGLNPFWSVLAIICWRGILRLGLLLAGLVWVLTLMMY